MRVPWRTLDKQLTTARATERAMLAILERPEKNRA